MILSKQKSTGIFGLSIILVRSKSLCDELSKWYQQYPQSYLAKHTYGALSGDYSQDKKHSPEEKVQLQEIAHKILTELFHDKKP